jgi:hypothetical protein
MPCIVSLTDEDRKLMRCDKSTKWADAVVVGHDSDGSVHLYVPCHPKSKMRSVHQSRLRPRKEDAEEYNMTISNPPPSSILVPYVFVCVLFFSDSFFNSFTQQHSDTQFEIH